MEAATLHLRPATVHVTGDALRIDGLVVTDECAARQAREAGADAAAFVTDAIGIGARVLDREQTAANADFVKAEFERAARELDSAFVERAAKVAERLDARVGEVFGAEDGQLAKLLARHFDAESATAVQHQVRDMLRASREELVRQFSSGDATNPLADFKQMARATMHQAAQQQAQQLEGMTARLEAMRLEIAALRAEREKLEAVAAEAERGTAKGRSYEEEVAAALDAIADAQGDLAEPCGDRSAGGGTGGKKGDVLVAVDACGGPARGRIVFEVKTKRLSRPEALRELDGALADREADYAVLVVPSEDKVPARMHELREINGDKLIVAFDAEAGDPLALRVAYGLARARVLMRRSGASGIDGAAVATAVERALQAFEDVRRIKQQLTGAKTKIDEAGSILDVMSAAVKLQLAEVEELVRAAEQEVEDGVARAAALPAAGAGVHDRAGTERPREAGVRPAGEPAARASAESEADADADGVEELAPSPAPATGQRREPQPSPAPPRSGAPAPSTPAGRESAAAAAPEPASLFG